MSGFICHDDYLAKTSKLTDEEVGRLFRALMKYHASGIADDLDGRESIAFDFIREDIDRTDAAYKAKCEKNRNNRMQAINDSQRPFTNVDDPYQKEKEKEINKEDKEKKEKKAELDARFNCFWKAYPRHEAKQVARKAFDKIDPDADLLAEMLKSIEEHKRSDQWTKDGGQYIPHPATWLNQKRWEDEVPKPSQPSSGTVKRVQEQAYDQRENHENTAQDVPEWFREYKTELNAEG